jgi:hypothetical protein
MNPVRKACLHEANKIWLDQPSLGMLETINEVRVAIRGNRNYAFKELPGTEAVRQWLLDAIAAGEMVGPSAEPRRVKANKSRRQE